MKLTYVKDYRSIKSFETVELKDFSILTGKNGSGKTQVFEAIRNNHIQVDELVLDDIIYFDKEQFKKDDEDKRIHTEVLKYKINCWTRINSPNNCGILDVFKTIKNNLLNNDECDIILGIVKQKDVSIFDLNKEDFEENVIFQHLQEYKDKIRQKFSGLSIRSGTEEDLHICQAIAEKSRKFISDFTQEEFIEEFANISIDIFLLQNKLGDVFLDYVAQVHDEKQNLFANDYHDEDLACKAEQKILKKYGGFRPWDKINEILDKNKDFDYRISFPDLHNANYFKTNPESFTVQLVHNEDINLKIPFSYLSSGEKILFALAITWYEYKIKTKFPKLLLLDEIDASLHPSMTEELFAFLNFIKDTGTKIILATQSPTTVALAPENNIFVVTKNSSELIKPVKSEEALRILSKGIVTLKNGITVMTQIKSENALYIISEGNNNRYLERFISTTEYKDRVKVVLLSKNGGKQNLFQYSEMLKLAKFPQKILIIYDCDVHKKESRIGDVFEYSLPENLNNIMHKKGIENLFEEKTICEYLEKTYGENHHMTELPDKDAFCNFILVRNNNEDFVNFNPILDKIKQTFDER